VKDIVLIPTFERPEMLQLCLEHLYTNPEVARNEVLVWIIEDHHVGNPPAPENGHVAIQFTSCEMWFTSRQPHHYWGPAYNILTGLREARDAGAEFIFLVEQDVMVAPDFIRWHRAVYRKQSDILASIGCRYVRYQGDETITAFLLARWSSSIGIAWRAENLSPVLEHANEDYFTREIEYLDERFTDGSWPWPGRWGSQDGMIHRVLRQSGKRNAFPAKPRCYHAGYYGKFQRKDKQTVEGATLGERIQNLRQRIRDREFMLEQSSGIYNHDCRVEDLTVEPWHAHDLECVGEFPPVLED
jgi:hypothetical protein